MSNGYTVTVFMEDGPATCQIPGEKPSDSEKIAENGNNAENELFDVSNHEHCVKKAVFKNGNVGR